jgi:hypothetical protein
MTGKGLQILHTYGDLLWAMGHQTPPNPGFGKRGSVAPLEVKGKEGGEKEATEDTEQGGEGKGVVTVSSTNEADVKDAGKDEKGENKDTEKDVKDAKDETKDAKTDAEKEVDTRSEEEKEAARVELREKMDACVLDVFFRALVQVPYPPFFFPSRNQTLLPF